MGRRPLSTFAMPFTPAALVFVAALFLTACASSTATVTAPAATQTPAAADAPPTSEPTHTPLPEVTATLAPGTFRNPVLDADFPDPDVLKVGGTYYAYATNTEGTNIQVATSDDLVTWTLRGDALPELPAWARQEFGYAWAPEVTTSAEGGPYLMYFTARFAIDTGGTQCIGVAVSAVPEGPFTPQREAPLICQVNLGGSIDAAAFTDDDGTRWLLWKNDGNSGGGRSWLFIQRVNDDGLSLLDEPARLITAEEPFEGYIVEGPTLYKHAGRYYLLYSANEYNTPKYAVGWAVADQPRGPYEKVREPLLASQIPGGIVGPGGQDIVLDPDGDTWLLFHGWRPAGYRGLYLAPLEWQDGEPYVAPLTREPLAVP
jgi:arabinan endo-1,5-alpha-L-arabinosidase